MAALTVGHNGKADIGSGVGADDLARVGARRRPAQDLPHGRVFARPEVGSRTLDWLSGACIATPRKTFLDLGGYDESFFVYCDDVTFARTCREAGLRQKLRTDVPVLHTGAGSGESPRRC